MGFCERLEELLKEKNIMQKDFLVACGLGKNSFSNWKNSKKGYPTAPVLKVISDYLGVSVEYLMGESDDRTQKKSPGQVTEAEGAKKAILDLIDGMSDDQLQKLETLIQAAKNVL